MFVGMQNSKLYFVKYKNLAHVHNRWVPEVDINITPGGPDLLSLFNKRNHTEKVINFFFPYFILHMRDDCKRTVLMFSFNDSPGNLEGGMD
jgi:hypothetical protein